MTDDAITTVLMCLGMTYYNANSYMWFTHKPHNIEEVLKIYKTYKRVEKFYDKW